MLEPFGPGIVRLIDKRLAQTVRRGERAVRGGGARELHALRIAVKRLRYTIEFAGALDDSTTRESLRLLASLQELLGTVADADVLIETLERFARDLAADDPRRMGLAATQRAAHLRREVALEAARAAWRGGDDAPLLDRLARAAAAAVQVPASVARSM